MRKLVAAAVIAVFALFGMPGGSEAREKKAKVVKKQKPAKKKAPVKNKATKKAPKKKKSKIQDY